MDTTCKTCRKCGDTKPLDAFRVAKTRSGSGTYVKPSRVKADDRRARCRECERAVVNASKTRSRRRKGARSIEDIRAENTARLSAANKQAVTIDTMRDALRLLMRRLLVEKCQREGVCLATAVYRARYRIDTAFREREIARTWTRKAASGVLRTDRRSLRRVDEDGTLDSATVQRLFADATACAYCENTMSPRDKTLDHMAPVSRGGLHSLANVVVCCKRCNSRKGDTPYDAWLARIGREADRAA